MEIVLTVTPEAARWLREGNVKENEEAQRISKTVRSLGVRLVPMHKHIRGRDGGLSTFFIIEGAKPWQVEAITGKLRGMKAVTGAYAKPDAAPASGLVSAPLSRVGFSPR
ncbi:hypothetical protein JL101_001265 [Skermanella rosea]|uniref:hypothetical protein n=1 Tax=Skermanella rosea TaxID=1817965 RepID=UPI001933E3AA|nr:hypothetical protein [Skermanella rosea]UEM04101.1 hypothetical protein JL101_001265 [Skermanella rosea]